MLLAVLRTVLLAVPSVAIGEDSMPGAHPHR
jgi:hypothetical protein